MFESGNVVGFSNSTFSTHLTGLETGSSFSISNLWRNKHIKKHYINKTCEASIGDVGEDVRGKFNFTSRAFGIRKITYSKLQTNITDCLSSLVEYWIRRQGTSIRWKQMRIRYLDGNCKLTIKLDQEKNRYDKLFERRLSSFRDDFDCEEENVNKREKGKFIKMGKVASLLETWNKEVQHDDGEKVDKKWVHIGLDCLLLLLPSKSLNWITTSFFHTFNFSTN